MKSTLNIEFESTMEMCDFFAKLNPVINLSYPGEEVAQANPGVIFNPTTTGGGIPLADSKPCCDDCQECADLKMERVFKPGPDNLHMPVVPDPVSPSALDKAAERIKMVSPPKVTGEEAKLLDKIFNQLNKPTDSDWKPSKLEGLCAGCGSRFARLHNAVKWCDSCRSKKAIAEASKKAMRSGRKSG